MPTRFAVIAIWAEDVVETAHFYRDVLRLDLCSHHGLRPHFRVDGVYLTILRGRPIRAQNADPERFPLFALAVDDLEAGVKRLEEHKIALPWGVESSAGRRWVMFHDPAGNLIELVQFST